MCYAHKLFFGRRELTRRFEFKKTALNQKVHIKQ